MHNNNKNNQHLEAYISSNYTADQENPSVSKNSRISFFAGAGVLNASTGPDLIQLFARLAKPFSEVLFGYIDRSGKTDSEIYKRANIDRRLFSKIRSKKGYTPAKTTVYALAVALELQLDDALILLESAGYTFSNNNKLDIIIEYYILKRKYDVFHINKVLHEYGLPLLGGRS